MILIRIIQLTLFVTILLLIGGCSKNLSNSKIGSEQFPTQNEALEHFNQVENIKGSIDLVTTSSNEFLLVTQSGQNTYFIGELKETNEGVVTIRISGYVDIGMGAGWELSTIDGSEYTIFFEKNDEKPYLMKLSNDDYFISIVEGHTLTSDSLKITNAIKEIVAIKSN